MTKMTENLLSRITLIPEINHGQPSIRQTRYMVNAILEYLAGGDSIDTILEEFPDIQRDDILACIAYDTCTHLVAFGGQVNNSGLDHHVLAIKSLGDR